MSFLFELSFDAVAASLIGCVLIRELMVQTLPDRIAGPGGWLIDTDPET